MSENIFDLGFDKNLQRGTNDTTGVVYDSVNQNNTASMVQGGNLTLKSLSIGGLVKQVAPGDDIQAAIDAVNREGGGVVQLLAKTYLLNSNIEMKNNVSLVGVGRDLTVLDFQGKAFGLLMVGISTSVLNNILLRDFTLQNSNRRGGIDIDYADFFRLDNVRTTSNDQAGVRIDHSRDFLLFGCRSDNNTDQGFYIAGDTGRTTLRFVFTNCFSESNTQSGFYFIPVGNSLSIYSLVSCVSNSNTQQGFNWANVNAAANATVSACEADSNSQNGFFIRQNDIALIGCQADLNAQSGFNNTGAYTKIIGCSAASNTVRDYTISSATSGYSDVFIGNLLDHNSSEVPTTIYSAVDAQVSAFGSIGGNEMTERKMSRMKSTTAIQKGAVVVFDPVASGDQITTTTTNGDNKVWGMLTNGILANNYEFVLKEGFTKLLLATNGTSSLAIGDFLSAYSHSYYAKKAVAGDTVFAICLEAPSTSTAVIDALLITPRLI